jgi:hypothetical protein
MIVASHQTNFLPGSSFFYKMAKADIFDLRYRAQFVQRNYHHRTKMRDRWFTLPLTPKPGHDPINTVRVDLPKAKTMFRQYMHGTYSGTPYYKTRGLELVERFGDLGSDYLWQINLDLILHLRDTLGITTPIGLGVDAVGTGAEGLLSTFRAYPGVTKYLSGTGAKKYMGDTSIFDAAGITVEWSRHDPVTDDSVVSLLMDHENPIEYILREHPETPATNKEVA